MGDGEREAGVGAAAVEQDRAGAALAVVAALLRAGEAEVLAQEVEQRGARVDVEAVLLAVDAERDLGHAATLPGRAAPPNQGLDPVQYALEPEDELVVDVVVLVEARPTRARACSAGKRSASVSCASMPPQPGMTSRPAARRAKSAVSVASLRTKPLTSRITESFSSSDRPVSASARSPSSSQATWLGDRRAADRDVQRPRVALERVVVRPRPARQAGAPVLAAAAGGGGSPSAASTISVSSSSLAAT